MKRACVFLIVLCFFGTLSAAADERKCASAKQGSSSRIDEVSIQQFLAAAAAGSLEDVKSWLARGMDVNARNEFGQTALHVVQKAETAQYLIKSGADVNARDKDFSMTPLFYQEVPVARLLVAAGADINARSKKGNTPLIWHSYNGYQKGIAYLLSKGADINAVNDDGQTALDVAETFANRSLAKYLRTKGARSNRLNR